ncbi:MAG: ATP-dependent helicase [Actinomycetota bacterium]|nr:MAG: ATP-dependent helicase [Actinomycetota bacterium]
MVITPGRLRDLIGVPLSDDQLEAATAPLAPGVIVAGAGTGKTTVMAARVMWLVLTGQVAPEAVLGLTFTTKAAAELHGRVRDLLRRNAQRAELPRAEVEPTVTTYHAFADRLVAEHGLRLGLEPSARLLTDGARHQVAYRVLCRTGRPLRSWHTRPVHLVGQLLALDDALTEHAVAPEDLIAEDEALVALVADDGRPQRIAVDMAATARRRIELAELVVEFREAKAAAGVLDFADQLRLATMLARRCPEVVADCRSRAAVVLLDEYQDTSVTQRLLLQHLFGGGHPVTAVGDPCQAIYAWRGASVHNIDTFAEHFPGSSAVGQPRPTRRFSLRDNRRSASAVIDVANRVAAPLRSYHAGVRALLGGAGKGGGELRYGLFDTHAAELDWIAGQVVDLQQSGRGWSDIAILCRAASEFPALAAALAARDVPVEVVGWAGLLQLPDVADVVSVLQILHDPTANAALVRLLTGPRWAIGPRDLAALGRRARALAGPTVGGRRPGRDRVSGDHLAEDAAGSDPVAAQGSDPGRDGLSAALRRVVEGSDAADAVALADALDDLGDEPVSSAARQRFSALAAELRELRRYVGEPLGDLVHRVVAVTGLDVELAAAIGDSAGQRQAAVAALVELAAEYRDVDGRAGLGGFLAWIADLDRFDVAVGVPQPPRIDAVQVLTVHRAKGLEFPVVVLPSLCRKVFPSDRSQDRWPTSPVALPYAVRHEPAPQALAAFPGPDGPRRVDHQQFATDSAQLELLDETRLAYVAVTRAEEVLVASGHWWGPTQSTPRGPSPFLEQIRAVADVLGQPPGPWAPAPGPDGRNPAVDADRVVAWPVPLDVARAAPRRALAEAVAAQLDTAHGDTDWLPDPAEQLGLNAADRGVLAEWDADVRTLLTELRRDEGGDRVVHLPAALTATQLQQLARDPTGLARALVRPMPRPPAARAVQGTRLHAWIETQYGQRPLLDPAELPGAADDGIDSDIDLRDLQEAFLDTDYAARTPVAIEEPFAVLLGGRVVRGRIDAVFHTPGGGWEVVDWKTGRAASADPLQLAIYRLAWAERVGVEPDQVEATFLHLRTRTTSTPAGLPGRAELTALLTGTGSADQSGSVDGAAGTAA